jgi:hypothetical protein
VLAELVLNLDGTLEGWLAAPVSHPSKAVTGLYAEMGERRRESL